MKKSSVIGIAIVVVAVVGVGAFALLGNKSDSSVDMGKMSSSTFDKSSDSAMVAPNTVIMNKLAFQQKTITVKKGTTVTWKNMDTAKHNVIFDDESVGKVEDNKLIAKGEELKFTFDNVGEFSYSCEPHPFMKAKIVVTE